MLSSLSNLHLVRSRLAWFKSFADPDEEEDENNNEEEEYELNDYCAGVLESDSFADFNNCQADENNEEEEGK